MNASPVAHGPLNNRQLVDNLCSVSGRLREARGSHVASFGTLIPHVFMSEVLACVGRGVEGDAIEQAEVRSILDSLENGMARGDRETRNVIAISFASDSQGEAFFGRLVPWLGPRLRAQLTRR